MGNTFMLRDQRLIEASLASSMFALFLLAFAELGRPILGL